MINPFKIGPQQAGTTNGSVRKVGVVRVLWGIPLTALGLWLIVGLFPRWNLSPGLGAVLLVALPGGMVLLGLIEVITGVPYSQWATCWDSLKGWQRLVLGIIVSLATFVVILGALGLYLGVGSR
ncbi:hypothetical protein BH09VER1_BH09VER1_48650 [soil metagenome]